MVSTRPLSVPRGLTLLECLVALALGLVLVMALVSHYLVAGQAARLQAAQSQMAEDAQIALHLLGSEIMLAGYAEPRSVRPGADGKPRWQTALADPPLWACDAGFVSPHAEAAAECAATGNSAGLELRYQADAHSTVPLSGTRRPSDCLGAGLSAQDGAYLTHNRWHVALASGGTELRCASRLGHGAQPLVENVETLAVWLAEALPSAPTQAVRYVRPSQVSDFALVTSVRVCLLMRSGDPVLGADAQATYLDCEGRQRASIDRRLRQAFHATFALRSRGGG